MKPNKRLSWLKEPAVCWSAIAFVLLVGLPGLIVLFVHSDAAMAACFLLFYAIDPVFAIAAGMFAGKDPRRLWFLPILIPILFIAGTWLCFDFADPAFTGYAFLYFLLGAVTMLIFLFLTNGKKR